MFMSRRELLGCVCVIKCIKVEMNPKSIQQFSKAAGLMPLEAGRTGSPHSTGEPKLISPHCVLFKPAFIHQTRIQE